MLRRVVSYSHPGFMLEAVLIPGTFLRNVSRKSRSLGYIPRVKTVLDNGGFFSSDILPRRVSRMLRTVFPVLKSNTGGERCCQNPLAKQEEKHHSGQEYSPFLACFAPRDSILSCTFINFMTRRCSSLGPQRTFLTQQ